ncbi:MAG: hypothetical protein LBC75_02615 [Fibromonadaceae bacterium]|jgi:hypothetical protein|nr:hypothetical protein [Fibromonadaceae bacterium]
MALAAESQLATYSERFHRELVIPQLINFDWRPDYEAGKGATTSIQVFAPGIVGKGSHIGTEAQRQLISRNIPATMEQYHGAVGVNSIDQTTLVSDFEKAVEPTVAAHVYSIEKDAKEAIGTAVSHVKEISAADLVNEVALAIGRIKNNSLESQVNVLMSPELMSMMAAKLLDKFNAPTPALEAFEGKIRRWQGASDIGQSIAMNGFKTGTIPTTLTTSAMTAAGNSIPITNTTQAYPKGTISIKLGAIAFDPIKGATGADLIVTNAADMASGATAFPLSFKLEAGATCSALPTAGAKQVVEKSDTSYGEIYVFRKAAVAGRSGVLTGNSVGKQQFRPNGGISIRRWQFSNGESDFESVRFDALLAFANVYPVGVSKLLVPM